MTEKRPLFANEADLVQAFCSEVERRNEHTHYTHPTWTIYHETAGWDLLLVEDTYGYQVGIEAKMTLNAKVLEQSLSGLHRHGGGDGPDYRAVLVPQVGLQLHLKEIAGYLGVTIITASGWKSYEGKVNWNFQPSLPDEQSNYDLGGWTTWLPGRQCKVPDYVPDVAGGKAAPVMLSEWKIKAIKLLVLLARKGFVTRQDMRALGLSESRWTAGPFSFLAPSREKGGYVAWQRTPDLRAQHPVNYAEIEADFDNWSTGLVTKGLL